MNLNKPFKYQLNEFKNSVLIFYLVIAILYLITFVSKIIFADGENNIQFGGMEMSSAIFLFVCGLNSFKETFHMLIQNSVSRKTIFVSRMLSFLAIGTGMAIFDTIILHIAKLIINSNDRIIVESFLENLYMERFADQSQLLSGIESLFYLITSYLAFVTIGYFITILYYRMNSALKIAVSVGVPVLVLFVYPVMDTYLFNHRLSILIGKIILFALGTPLHAILSFLVITILAGGFSWLLMRTAMTKSE